MRFLIKSTLGIFAGGVLGVLTSLYACQQVAQLILSLLPQNTYSWNDHIDFLTHPFGLLLGIISGLAVVIWRDKPLSSYEFPVFDRMAAASRVCTLASRVAGVFLILWLGYLILGAEIIENYRLGPQGWTHQHLPFTLGRFFAYYSIPVLWTIILALCGRQLPD